MNYTQTLMNFGEYGYPSWCPISSIEMEVILAGVMEMFDAHTEQAIQEVYDRIRLQLLAEIWDNQIPTDDWITHAVMLTAIRGMQGKQIKSDILFID